MDVVFDVNETLLDLGAVGSWFQQRFGDEAVMREWFARLLQASMTVTLTDAYRDFGQLAAAALDVVAARHGVELDDAYRAGVWGTMGSLPPHPDASAALRALEEGGVRLAALTNSPPDMALTQLTNAGLAPFFSEILSVDTVRRFKPAPEPYLMAAATLGIAPEILWMVAAHDWDVAGAMGAGCNGVLVLRSGISPNPAYPPPTMVAADLREAAALLLAVRE